MAFPTTGILDDFDRADGDPGPNWLAPLWNGVAFFQILSNEVRFSSIGTQSDGYWVSAADDADCEVYVDFPTIGFGANIYLRLAGPGATVDGYRLVFAANAMLFYRLDNGSVTQLGALETPTIASGDSVGFEAIGTDLNSYQKTGGTWSFLYTRSDATYTDAGFFGMGSDQTNTRADNFGGGPLPEPLPEVLVPHLMMRGRNSR